MSQVAKLSWLECTLASTLYTEPPTATYPEAVEHCLKAESLSPTPSKENRLLLAKCHIKQGNYADAVCWLDRALQVPVITPEVSQNIIRSSYMNCSDSVKVLWHCFII
jgi:tetratricopeptide (TPR) repeat protein